MTVKDLKNYLNIFEDEELEIKIRVQGTNTSSTSLVNPEDFIIEEGKGLHDKKYAIINTSLAASI